MALDEVLQTDLVNGALVTLLAAEGELPCVRAHVELDMASLGEGALAHLALEGLPCMSRCMALEVNGLKELFVTCVADESSRATVVL